MSILLFEILAAIAFFAGVGMLIGGDPVSGLVCLLLFAVLGTGAEVARRIKQLSETIVRFLKHINVE